MSTLAASRSSASSEWRTDTGNKLKVVCWSTVDLATDCHQGVVSREIMQNSVRWPPALRSILHNDNNDVVNCQCAQLVHPFLPRVHGSPHIPIFSTRLSLALLSSVAAGEVAVPNQYNPPATESSVSTLPANAWVSVAESLLHPLPLLSVVESSACLQLEQRLSEAPCLTTIFP